MFRKLSSLTPSMPEPSDWRREIGVCRRCQHSSQSRIYEYYEHDEVGWQYEFCVGFATNSLTYCRFLSPDGRCYTFDERANGYARGEGVGYLILKPLEDALRDRDAIRAIIRGSGSNSDGKTSGITLPSGTAQEQLIRDVYDTAGLDPLDTEYVECHGTGTQAGDPQETSTLARVFSTPERSPGIPLRIGSVKTNIGHLEGASGIAGAIKAIMMLENRMYLPNRNFQKLNPRIRLDEWKLKVSPQTLSNSNFVEN